MNKLLIINCKSKVKSLLSRIRGKEITHTLVTNNGDKIKCSESIELYSNETKIIVAKCLRGIKEYIITINSDNIDYVLEKYDDDVWDQILNITVNTDDNVVEDRLYG